MAKAAKVGRAGADHTATLLKAKGGARAS